MMGMGLGSGGRSGRRRDWLQRRLWLVRLSVGRACMSRLRGLWMRMRVGRLGRRLPVEAEELWWLGIVKIEIKTDDG